MESIGSNISRYVKEQREKSQKYGKPVKKFDPNKYDKRNAAVKAKRRERVLKAMKGIK
jgi:hypothetical protein